MKTKTKRLICDFSIKKRLRIALAAKFAEQDADELIIHHTVFAAGLGVKVPGIGDRKWTWLPLYDINNRQAASDWQRHPCAARVLNNRGFWMAEITLLPAQISH